LDPESNPFVNDDTWETDEVFALGFRNPHHIAFAEDGTIMVVDVGRANAEEVNVISAGSNHGWPDREGTFTHLKEDGGGFLTGIAALPANDADTGFTYPAAQYGHVGSYGNPFTGHSIAGGFVVENGSDWDGQYLYGDFVSFGDIYHTSLQGLQDAVTQGAPDSLTQSTTRRARVQFDHDNYFSHSGSRRADLRFGQGPDGEIYVMNKRNNTIYLVTNSVSARSIDNTGGTTPPSAVAPTTPENFRNEVYSPTTAELFWDRSVDDGFVRGYEIFRNDEPLGIFDSLSLFQDDLDPSTIYNYTITAIDTDGNRSGSASMALSTTGNVDVDPGNSPTASAPIFSANLRNEVYSATTAELFWDRATDDGFVQGSGTVRPMMVSYKAMRSSVTVNCRVFSML